MTLGQASLGILGGGQLAQMLALAAIPLGVQVVVLEPDPHAPARVCAEHIVAPYTDAAGLARLAQCSAVTLEFENVPLAALKALSGRVAVRPAATLLAHSKHRAREKAALRAAGVPTAAFKVIERKDDFSGALAAVGGAGILKTAELGYDGKGQVRAASQEELALAWDKLGQVPCVLEELVPFVRELSIGVARSGGQVALGGLTENVHRNGVLRRSVYLPGDPAEARARQLARAVAEQWSLEGLLTLELFELPSGQLVANEVAPRVHNSAHLTQDGGGMSQFEAQVRAALGWALHDFAPKLPCAMVNILGWDAAPPDWAALQQLEGTRLHLYGKANRPGRKLGHVNVVAQTQAELLEKLAAAEALIP